MPDDAPVWRELTVTSEQCAGRFCPQYDRCWVTQMRRRAQTAALVIVNHHLYLADAALRQELGDDSKALLPGHDAVIFDEAHELDEIAGQHFGYQVSERRVHELARDVGRAVEGKGLLPARVAPALTALNERAHKLFGHVPEGHGRMRLRAGMVDDTWAQSHLELDAQLLQLESTLSDSDHDEIRTLATRTALLAAELSFVLDLPGRASLVHETMAEDPEGVEAVPYLRYSDVGAKHRTLVARPVDVAPLLGRLLRRRPAVFMSATLRVGNSFTHFRRAVGLHEAEEIAVESPFDYENQACLYLPDDLPDPDHPSYPAASAERVTELVRASGGGAFVLCTSHRALSIMRSALLRAGVPHVLTQGEAPKTHLVENLSPAKQCGAGCDHEFLEGC